MSEVAINYKGSDITTMNASGTKTLLTSGKYCEGDITVTYARPSVTPTLETVTKTYTPSTTAISDTITPSSGYDGIDEVDVTVNAMPTGTAGTPTATKGAVSNHSVSVTPSVTNTTGYITGSTKTGTAVTVSASELVSGSETKTDNGTYDVTNLEELVVDVTQWKIGTASVTNSSATATSISFTVSGEPKMFFARCTTTLTRSSSYKYYYVATMRWNGENSETRGNRWYMYNGQFSNISSGYSFSYSNGTLTLSSSGSQTTSPGSFYNGTYELTYICEK